MAKQNLKDLMAKRNPLTPREAIIPADLYTNPQVDKTISGQSYKDTSSQVTKPTTPQVEESTSSIVEKTTSSEVDESTKPQSLKPISRQIGKTTKPLIEKYTTHLRQETIKSVKREAFESDRKDYEIVQEALDRYFKAKEG